MIEFDAIPILDTSQIRSIFRETTDSEWKVLGLSLLRTFKVDADRQVASLCAGTIADDSSVFEGAAHALAGSAGNLGLMRLARMCRHIEAESRVGAYHPSPQLNLLLLQTYQVSLKAFEEAFLIQR